ncbi:MAG: MATE family efflux transporter [Eubacteriales bacterium]
MTTEPVERLIVTLAIPTIISMLVTSFYNLADAFFVRQLSSDSMVAAVGVVLPLMSIIQAFGFFCGHGSGNYISRAFGRKDYRDAEIMASTGFFYSVFFGLLITIAGLLFIRPFALLLGAKTAPTIAATIDYMKWILIATPFMTGAIVLNNQLRMQGNAFFAMVGLTSGAIINLILDPLLIFQKGDVLFDGSFLMPFGAGMGIGGAALATAISQILSFIFLLVGMMRSDNIKIRLKNFSPRLYYIRGIVQGGLPSLARQGLASISVTCLNHAVGLYLHEDVMIDAVQAAMTGTSKLMNFLLSALIGFGQGFQPVCGFNYGAKLYDRVKRSYWFCVKISAVVLLGIAVVGFLFAEPITAAIAGTTSLAAEIAAFAFRAQLISFPLMSWVILCNMLLQNIGMTARATIVAMARQGLTFIPSVLLLPLLLQSLGQSPVLGLQLAQPVADLLAFVISVPIGAKVLREMGADPKETRQVPLAKQ